MGASVWSNDFYADREAERKAKGVDAFAHHRAVAAKPRDEQHIHELMSPKRKQIREARDSAEHPNSLPVAVLFDITGSMRESPRAFQAKLGALMNRLIAKGYTADPQILVGCIGDTNDRQDDAGNSNFDASCQVGEFESGIEIDDCLGRCWLAGGGGGSNHESYQNMAYFFARHVETDCYEKRGQKGIIVMLGDEHPYDVVSRAEVKSLFNIDIQDNIPTKQIFAELAEKWDVFFVIPREAYNGSDAQIFAGWKGLLGDANVLSLERAENVSELVALLVGIREGKITDLGAVRQDLQTEGLSGTVVNGLLSSVRDYAASKGLVDNSTTTRL